MRKLMLFISFLLVTIVNAQTTIKMEKADGIYKVKCKVNGAPMKMYFDTGASNVSISLATAIYLYDNDLITDADFVGQSKTMTADGSISDNMVINLKDIEIAGLHIKNVQAVVSSSLVAPLLMGQSVIQKLGKISLDGDILTIHSVTPGSKMTQEERNELDNQLKALREKKGKESCYKVLDIIAKIEKSEELNEYEHYLKVAAESNLKQFDNVIVDAESWLRKYSAETDSTDLKMRVFFMSAKSNLLSEKGDKELGWSHLERCKQYFSNDFPSSSYWITIPVLTHAYCKYKGNGYSRAVFTTKAAINYFMKDLNISIDDINKNKYPDNPMISYLFRLLSIYNYDKTKWLHKDNTSDWNDSENKIINNCTILGAKMGDKFCVDWCHKNKMNYSKRLTQSDLDLVGLDNY